MGIGSLSGWRENFLMRPFAKPAREALRKSLTVENLKQEAAYLSGMGRTNFERPYGLAWLLQLSAELREWDDPEAKEMLANLRPLEEARPGATDGLVTEVVASRSDRRARPDRVRAWSDAGLRARPRANESFTRLLIDRARKFYLADKSCPMAYEPSGEDFLSPCLAEADVMRRVLPPPEFGRWLKDFLPQVPGTAKAEWLPVVISPDPSDPKLAHLDGLNLSRAWMLEGIISVLPSDDPRRPALVATAEAHRRAGLEAVTRRPLRRAGTGSAVSAVYLVTGQGVRVPRPK